MMYLTKIFTILLISEAIYAQDNSSKCKSGFSSQWIFDQNNSKISMGETAPKEVCNFITKQLNSNFKIVLRGANKKVLFENKVYWAKIVRHDIIGKKLTGVSKKSLDYKIIKFPIALKLVHSYEITELRTDKIFGKGKLK